MQRIAWSQESGGSPLWNIWWRQWAGEVLHWKDSYRLSGTGWDRDSSPVSQCRLDGKEKLFVWISKERSWIVKVPQERDGVGRNGTLKYMDSVVWLKKEYLDGDSCCKHQNCPPSKCPDLASVLLKSGLTHGEGSCVPLIESTHVMCSFYVAEIIPHTKEHDIVLALAWQLWNCKLHHSVVSARLAGSRRRRARHYLDPGSCCVTSGEFLDLFSCLVSSIQTGSMTTTTALSC